MHSTWDLLQVHLNSQWLLWATVIRQWCASILPVLSVLILIVNVSFFKIRGKFTIHFFCLQPFKCTLTCQNSHIKAPFLSPECGNLYCFIWFANDQTIWESFIRLRVDISIWASHLCSIVINGNKEKLLSHISSWSNCLKCVWWTTA